MRARLEGESILGVDMFMKSFTAEVAEDAEEGILDGGVSPV